MVTFERITSANKVSFTFNPFSPKSDLVDFTLSNASRFYSSKGDPLGVKGSKHLCFLPYKLKAPSVIKRVNSKLSQLINHCK